MQVPEKKIQASSSHDEKSINSKPSTIYKHKKFLRSRFEKAMSTEENLSSQNGSLLEPNEQEEVRTAEVQPPVPPNPPPIDTTSMINNLEQEIEDDSTENITEFNQPEDLKAVTPVTNPAQSEDQPRVMCRDFARGTCKKGLACTYAHQIILSQLPGVYIFCKDFQNAWCHLPKCKFVHATENQQEHYFRTGYLPPHTLAHLEEFSLLQPPPPPPKSEEASAEQPIAVYCNVPLPPSPMSCTASVETAKEGSEPDTFRAQPGTSTSSQNPEWSEFDIRSKVTAAAAQPPLQPSSPRFMIEILKCDTDDDEDKCGYTETLTELNHQGELTAAAGELAMTAQSEERPGGTMCQNFVRGLCKLGAECNFVHEVISSQLPGVYFCNNFQNARCPLPKCEFVHATAVEQEHYLRTGYLPPHTVAHLEEFSVLQPPSPPLNSEETSADQPTVYYNVPPPPPISGTAPVETARQRSESDTFKAQPGTSTSSQNPECSEIDIRRKVTHSQEQVQDIDDDADKCDSTKSLTKLNLQVDLTVAKPTVMCRNFVRGLCRLGERCIFEHEIILTQLPGIYNFCRNFQNSVCLYPKCKFVHATVGEQEHYYKTGYLPLHTRAHFVEFSELQSTPRPSQSEEASAQQPTFYCNVPPPAPPVSGTPDVPAEYNAEAAREGSEQTGTNTSSQNPERSEINTLRKRTAAAAQLSMPPTTTAEFKDKSTETMCRNFARGFCSKGAACLFKHEIILSQLTDVYSFCRNYQNVECYLPQCKYVHATVSEKEHFYRTGYLPPHTLAHLKESSESVPASPAPESEEAPAEQPTVYCDGRQPEGSLISCTAPVEAAGERSEPDTFRAQPGTSASSQNPEWNEIEEASKRWTLKWRTLLIVSKNNGSSTLSLTVTLP